ncbi:MAG TPA: preprotein translocase subunit SecA [Candidatus Angelobacter sp.]|nr:preprotein translocase subunit SecA [Candidatus Angelobacter sp.]
MIGKALAKVFGTSNEREIKRLKPLVDQMNQLAPQMKQLTDEQLRGKTAEFRARILERLKDIDAEIARLAAEMKTTPDQDIRTQMDELGKKRLTVRNEVLDEILPEAFAVCREGGQRALNMRHFDVQLIGGIVLHQGKISEMKTGEGKTLVATLPVYLNALSGDGVHVVTVNDYLAKRDSEWMGKLYRFLGLSVGVIVHDLDDDERREAYAADVTYGTNNEYGFDYLRDNMKFDLAECVQRGHNFGIVDEVDSILIDEARTPLIISGQSDESTDKYDKANRIIPHLVKGEEIEKPPGEPKEYTGDFVIDEKHKNTMITDEGWEKAERLLGIDNIADPENWAMKHHVETAVKAHHMYRRDVEYVVKEGEVIIVDEFTGRLMPGRRWSDGLHQAIEAKEGVKIERETQTLATITFQNYFRMYKKLAGMTGTAETEAAEFDKIYKLQVVVIPTNKPLLRKENADIVYRTEKEKYYAVSDEVQKISAEGRPILVGTTSIEKSERLSDLLKKKQVKHVVLNAKFHEKEAEIVAQAGRFNSVTIATNMAGRGTDILLGGNAEFMGRQEMVKKGIAQQLRTAGGEVALEQDTTENIVFYYNGQEYKCPADKWNEAYNKYKKETDAEHDKVVSVGGLHILGTERHEARRIDNQLRGRAGRQGDPGSSRFYLSLEDDLMRIFAKAWVSTLLQRLGMEEGVPIESKLISRRIEAAQKAVEAQNFESRKHVLEYDDVMNKQRVAVYGLRKELLAGIDQKGLILEDYVATMVGSALDRFAPRNVHADQWDIDALNKYLVEQFGLDMAKAGVAADQLNRQELGDEIFEKLKELYEGKERQLGADAMRYHERMIMLSVLDTQWKDHLLSMDHLKEGINLRGYGQHDPLVEYKRESFDMFENMMQRSQEDAVRYLFHMQIMDASAVAAQQEPAAAAQSGGNGDQQQTAPLPPRKRASTSMDDLEAQFQRRKKKELEQARMAGSNGNTAPQQVVRGQAKVGRNDPCPCGSGKKFKKCHGAGTAA